VAGGVGGGGGGGGGRGWEGVGGVVQNGQKKEDSSNFKAKPGQSCGGSGGKKQDVGKRLRAAINFMKFR